MGDRTTVELTVMKSHFPQVKALLDDFYYSYTTENESFVTTIFYNVNYGNLMVLPFLIVNGIAYNSYWEKGDEYTSGTEYGRFLEDGTAIVKTIYDNEMDMPMNKLLEVIDDYEALKAAIRKREEELIVLPFDNQEAWGKIYLTKKLIGPSHT